MDRSEGRSPRIARLRKERWGRAPEVDPERPDRRKANERVPAQLDSALGMGGVVVFALAVLLWNWALIARFRLPQWP